MRISKEELKKRFDHYNQMCFGGKLGKCQFKYLPSRDSSYGMFSANTDKQGKTHCSIWIRAFNDTSDDFINGVLLHEMIHMYIYTIEHNKGHGLFGHGSRFKWHRKRLWTDYGLKVNMDNPNKTRWAEKLWHRVIYTVGI